MSLLTRLLNVRWNPLKLKQDVNLAFCFASPSLTGTKLSSNQNLVAWRVVNMKATPPPKNSRKLSQGLVNDIRSNVLMPQDQELSVLNYTAKWGFGRISLNNADNMVDSQSVIECQPGEVAKLIGEQEYPVWDDPTPDPQNPEKTFMRAQNSTEYRQILSIGTMEPEFSSTYWWKVGAGQSIRAIFSPKLIGYVNTGHQEGQFINTDIASSKIWEQDLEKIPATSDWNFTEDDEGKYSLDPAQETPPA